MTKVYSADELNELSIQLIGVEDWLRDVAAETVRNADVMADVIDKAWHIVDAMYDEAVAREAAEG